MKWTLYDKTTGEFSAVITGPDDSCLVNQVSDNIGAKEGRWKRTEHKVINDEIVPIEG